MGIDKNKIDFDPTAPTEHDRIGSYIIAADGTVITDAGSSGSLDVYLNNPTIAVTQSGTWDIGTLTTITNDVNIADGGNVISVDDAGGSLTVDGTVTATVASDVAEDAAVSGGDTVSLQGAYRQDALATDTSADGDASFIKVNAKGEQYVIDTDGNALLTTIDADTSSLAGTVSGSELQVDIVAALPAGDNNIGNVDIVSMPGQYVEDAAAAGGETGNFILGVRQDASGSPVSADGDYHGLIFNNDGELKVAADLTSDVADDAADSGNPVKIGGKTYTQASALGAIAASDRYNLAGDLYRRTYVNDSFNVGWSHASVAVSTSAVQLDASKQAGRKKAIIQNLGDKAIYVGSSGSVITGTGAGAGIEIPRSASMEFRWGEALDIYAIGDTGASAEDVRIAQFA